MERIQRKILTIVALLIGINLAGVIGFMAIEGWTFLDALYMSAITITTVGYMEVHTLSNAGRVFNLFLLIGGVTMMFYIMATVTQIVLELELSDYFGKRRTKKVIDRLTDHYILCGFGRVGRAAAAELLRTGVSFVVMDKNPDKVEWAIKMGCLAVMADCSRDEMLRDVGVTRAKGLIAALSNDAENLFLILSAKTLNPMLNVSVRVAEEEAESKMRRAGADAVYMPYSMTGYRLAQAIVRPHVFEFLDITSTSRMGLNVGMEQVRVDDHCALAGKSLRDLQLRREIGVIVLAIRRLTGAMDFNPPADALLNGGDVLIVMGKAEDVRKLEETLAVAKS
ncbi:MAG: potassium channel protein [Acidobacteriota bacterium]